MTDLVTVTYKSWFRYFVFFDTDFSLIIFLQEMDQLLQGEVQADAVAMGLIHDYRD